MYVIQIKKCMSVLFLISILTSYDVTLLSARGTTEAAVLKDAVLKVAPNSVFKLSELGPT